MPVTTRRWIGFALLVLAIVALRWNGLDRMMWNIDEGATFTMAEQVRAGDVIYRDAADARGPLVPYVKAILFTLVGDWNVRGIHLGVAIMIGLTACFVTGIMRRLGHEAAGWFAGSTFALFSISLVGLGDLMAAHTEWFLIFFSALGFLFFVRAWNGGRWPWAVLSGMCFGLSFLAKQPALLDFGVTWVLCALGFVFLPKQRKHFIRIFALLILGWGFMLIGTIAYFTAKGAYDDFVFYVWTYNTKYYVPEIPRAERWKAMFTLFHLGWAHLPVAFSGCLLAGAWLFARAFNGLLKKRPVELHVLPWLILGWTAAGIISTGLSGRDFDHYSVQAMPGLAMAAGWGIATLWKSLQTWSPLMRWTTKTILFGYCLSLLLPALKRTTQMEADTTIYPKLAEIIQSISRPDERIFVWGYAPELYVFSKRLPASRYIYTNYVTGMIPWTNLDPEIDTTYAIVPRGPELLMQDLHAQKPVVIVDTNKDRGYLKYPLKEQAVLWAFVQDQYAEIATDRARALDYTLYKRLEVLLPATIPAGLEISPNITLSGPSITAQTARIEAIAPAGTTHLSLYVDGQLYRRVKTDTLHRAAAAFFFNPKTFVPGEYSLTVVAEGLLTSQSHPLKLTIDPAYNAPTQKSGPPLIFDGQKILPNKSSGLIFLDDQNRWEAHTPSRIEYDAPIGLEKLILSYGFLPGAYDGSQTQRTDGARVIVELIDNESNKTTRVFNRYLKPTKDYGDRGLQTSEITLPAHRNSRLVFRFQLGPAANPAYGWTYWGSIQGKPIELALSLNSKPVYPQNINATLGLSHIDINGGKAVMAHAPSQIDFPFVPGMRHLTGRYGLMDEAWTGLQKTSGIIFEVLQGKPDGSSAVLFSRQLNPAQETKDRGVQRLDLKLPDKPEGTLQFIARPAHGQDNSFGYAYWQQLSSDEINLTIPAGKRQIAALRQRAQFGLSFATEENRDVLFAHSPTSLTFPLDPSLRALEGNLGMLRASYTDGKATEGVSFVVEIATRSGETREVFRRTLNPKDNEADRGFLPFSISLKPEPGDMLVLRTEPAIAEHYAYTWSFWSDLRFQISTPIEK